MAIASQQEIRPDSEIHVEKTERPRANRGFLPELRRQFAQVDRKLTPDLAQLLLRAAVAYRDLDHLETLKIYELLDELYPAETWDWLLQAGIEISNTTRPTVSVLDMYNLANFIKQKTQQLSALPEYAQMSIPQETTHTIAFRQLESALSQWASLVTSLTTLDDKYEFAWQISDPVEQNTILQTIYLLNSYALSILQGETTLQVNLWQELQKLPQGFDTTALLPTPNFSHNKIPTLDTRYQHRIFMQINQLNALGSALSTNAAFAGKFKMISKIMYKYWDKNLRQKSLDKI